MTVSPRCEPAWRRTGPAAVALLVLTLAGCAHTAARSAAMRRLAEQWPVTPVQAWISGHRLSVVLPGETGPMRFRARWERGGLDEHGYGYRTAELTPADLTAGEGERPDRARSVTVLDAAEWSRFSQAFRDRLTPRGPGQALLLQAGGGEFLLHRDAAGAVVLDEGAATASNLNVGRRMNQVEAATEAVRFMESEAAARGDTATAFLFVLPRRTGGGGLVLFDTSRHLCVAVTLPQPGPRREGSPLGRGARTLLALTLEAHGIAVLKNPVSSAGRLVNIFGQWLSTWATRHKPSTQVPVPPLAQAPPMNLSSWEGDLDHLTFTRRTRGAIRLLLNGEEYFPLLEQRIREARESISMRVNIFDSDDVAVHIADLLRQRSQDVRVRVVMDQVSTLGAANTLPGGPMPRGFMMPSSIWGYLERGSKVAARAFLNPWMSCDHSKVFLFDRRYAHIGGMNIGREYRHEWHDMMVELEGPVVGRFTRDFERSWAHASALGDLAFLAAAVTTRKRFAGEAERPDYLDLRVLYTRTADLQLYEALMGASRRARSTIWVENPYLYENSFVTALVEARRRGVDVRVILPSDSDIGLGDASNKVTANLLIANGVRVFVYPGMTHVKAALFDGWACIGSANFNKLSLRRNLETNIATSDARFVSELRQRLFEHDFAVSTELTRPVEVSSSDRFAEWLLDQF